MRLNKTELDVKEMSPTAPHPRNSAREGPDKNPVRLSHTRPLSYSLYNSLSYPIPHCFIL